MGAPSAGRARLTGKRVCAEPWPLAHEREPPRAGRAQCREVAFFAPDKRRAAQHASRAAAPTLSQCISRGRQALSVRGQALSVRGQAAWTPKQCLGVKMRFRYACASTRILRPNIFELTRFKIIKYQEMFGRLSRFTAQAQHSHRFKLFKYVWASVRMFGRLMRFDAQAQRKHMWTPKHLFGRLMKCLGVLRLPHESPRSRTIVD